METMILECIDKIRDRHNRIVSYILGSDSGNTYVLKADALKEGIETNRIKVSNLKLTSDRKLIDSVPNNINNISNNKYTEKSKLAMEKLLGKAKVLGATVRYLPTACGRYCPLISLKEDTHIIYIPADVILLNMRPNSIVFSGNYLQSLTGNVRVLGGGRLRTLFKMFEYCKFSSIDLSQLDTSSVLDMGYMFMSSTTKKVNFSNIDTSNVKTMQCMFNGFTVDELDLSSFDTSKVENMCSMFMNSTITKLNISSFKTSNVRDMSYMFSASIVDRLDLSSFDTTNVSDMNSMFAYCETDRLDLRSFNTWNVDSANEMFYHCTAKFIDLSSFRFRCIDDENIFYGCKSKVKITDSKLLDLYDRRIL